MARTARRDAHSGSLYQRNSDGMWVAYVTLPDRDGKRRRKVKTHRTKAGASRILADMRRELDRAGDLPTSSPTLATWMTLWLDTIARPRLKPRTFATYQGYINTWIIPALGTRRLDRLTPAHVREMHDAIERAGRSTTTALQAHRILAKALTDAEREGRVTRNVATLLDAPRRAVSTRTALTADQAVTLLRSVATNPDEAPHWTIALLTGMRQGERLGITRDAIDLEAETITVSWQVQRLRWEHGCATERPSSGWPCEYTRAGYCPERHVRIPSDQEARQVYGGLWMTRPKSRAGWREVPMAPLLTEVIRRHLEVATPGDEGLIFHRGDGHPIDPRDDSAAWDAALKRAGLPDAPLHSARHTTATLLLELGVDERTRMAIMGHNSAAVTAGYTHVSTALGREAMARLGEHLALGDGG